MWHRRIIIPLLLAGGLLALAACGRDEPVDLDVGEALTELSVIDAVQLGAEQGCRDLAGRVTGSVSIKQLEEADGLVLLLEEGYPLCIDTLEVVALELELIELSYQEELIAEVEGSMTTDEVIQLMDSAGDRKDDEPGGIDQTDPNPQPALESGTPTPAGRVMGVHGDVQPPEGGPTSPTDGPTSPPDPPPETSD
jgi:hypothetical protein